MNYLLIVSYNYDYIKIIAKYIYVKNYLKLYT